MIVVREVFIAKPGMASKLATMFKDQMAQEASGNGSKVMTDMTGVYNKVVIETEYEDMAAYDREMQEYLKQPRPKPDPSKPSHVDMYMEGKREIFRIW
jgi:hypothetical protein